MHAHVALVKLFHSCTETVDVWRVTVSQTASELQKPKVAPSSDEYVLDQLTICEEKLLRLLEELQTSGNDVEQLTQQMEAEEVN